MDLSDRPELVWLGTLAADLKQAAPNREPLLVGATARDILLHHGLGVRPARATEDVDIALAAHDWKEHDALDVEILDYHR